MLTKDDFLPGYFITTEQASLDDTNSQSLVTGINRCVVNFDHYTEDHCRTPNKPARSNDALLLTPVTNYFIEFKNSPIQNLEKLKLYEKNYESILTLVANTNEDLATIFNNYEYILVYNAKNSAKNQIRKGVAKLANMAIIPFKLKKFEYNYLKKVHAYSPSEFEKFLESI